LTKHGDDAQLKKGIDDDDDDDYDALLKHSK